ncbi:MAG: hypothetical protein GY807_13095 [Gammaproteobacteria bacterium]|nr:hypothetical protein [Gammaproteobacteria bacterium]
MQAIQAKAVSPPQNNYSALSERELRRVAEFVGRWVGPHRASRAMHTIPISGKVNLFWKIGKLKLSLFNHWRPRNEVDKQYED